MSEVTVSPARQPRKLGLRAFGDEHLARLASGGDRSAFAAIYDRYHQALYRYCRSIVHDPDDATDALQSTMVSALRGLPARNRQAPLKPWLFRIAHNESINVLRRRRVHEEIDSATTRAGTDPERDVALRQSLRQLVADLRQLPERQRGALVMRELSGLEYEEIGEAFGVTPAAAKQTVYEARVALQQRAEGREMDCEAVRRSLSEGDRRILRGRRIRAHLGDCRGCASFAEALRARPAQLAAMAPPLAPGAAAGLLKGVLGGTVKGGGETGAAAAVAGGGGNILAGSVALKTFAVATVAVTAGAVGAASGHLPGPLGNLAGGDSKEHARPAPHLARDGSGSLRRLGGRPEGERAGDRADKGENDAKERAGGGNEPSRSGSSGDSGAADSERGGSDRSPAGRAGGLPAAGGRRTGRPLPGILGDQIRHTPVRDLPRPQIPDVPPVTVPKVDPPSTPKLGPVRLP